MKIEILEQHGFHFLWVDDQLWMWDIPNEDKYQEIIAEQAYGDVLVAGYGLGIVQKYLKQNKRVKSVHSFEQYQGVMDECQKCFGEIYGSYTIGDFFKLNPGDVDKVDCIIGDVWVDIVPESLDAYREFKKVSNLLLKDGGEIIAWGQDFFEYLLEKNIDG